MNQNNQINYHITNFDLNKKSVKLSFNYFFSQKVLFLHCNSFLFV